MHSNRHESNLFEGETVLLLGASETELGGCFDFDGNWFTFFPHADCVGKRYDVIHARIVLASGNYR